MKKHHEVVSIHFSDTHMILDVDGAQHEFVIAEISPLLEKATSQERNTFQISPSGYGIHWPMLDEDLSIDGLLGIKHMPPQAIAK